MPNLYVDEKLLDYCATNYQEQIIKHIIQTGSLKDSAQQLEMPYTKVRSVYRKIKAKAALHGFSPENDLNHPTSDAHYVKGTSTLYGDDGQVRMQWVKTDAKAQEAIETVRQIADELKAEIPRHKPTPPPKHGYKELLNTYVVTDYHLGMLAWGEETGDANWDTKQAEQLLVQWLANAIQLSPQAEKAIFAQLGDFLHWDGIMPVTPTSGHILDADGRFQKLIRVAVRCIVKIAYMMLDKYPEVHLLMAEGNHDISSSMWLREMLAFYFEDEPRITVDVSPDPYYCVEHGDTSLFFHHGHKKRMAQISGTFVSKFREVFGRTKYSYAHMGHLHHVDVKEDNLMIVEQHQTLSAKDSHASRGGYASGRSASVITYHDKYGEVSRLRLTPESVV